MGVSETYICGGVASALEGFAWISNYRVNPSVGLDCFIRALKEKMAVEVDDSARTVTATRGGMVGGEYVSSSAILSYDEIQVGWGGSPKSSVNSLYDSIHIFYDRMRKSRPLDDLDHDNPESKWWEELRGIEAGEIKDRMKAFMLPSFMRYQENMFVHVDGTIPRLRAPTFADISFKKFEALLKSYDGTWEEDESGYRFNADMMDPEDYFWADYYGQLAGERGYAFSNKEMNSHLQLLSMGAGAFEHHSVVNWVIKD